GGPFDGARIIGKWTKNGLWGETVGLTFDRMNWKGQEVADVELIAFHPESSLPGFATEVDHHYLQRFVGVAMRAIGAGGTAAIQSRRQVIQQFNDQGQLTGVQQNALHYELARELFMMEALK